jgi:NADP-dependent 3-hydroxy acid dehydrogenase YdfG
VSEGGLEGKVAFVTGASRGVGAAVARRLAQAGARIGMASRTEDDLGIAGSVVRACDVRDRAQVEEAVAATVAAFGRLDIVVANAGIGAYGDFLDLDPEVADAMIDVNLKGTLWTARAALPHLIAGGGGDFVALASVAGLRAFPGEAVYNASKFGQVGFTRALDHELRERGVRCTAVCPGGVATDFAMGAGRSEDMPELAGMLRPEDVAEVVLFTVTRPPGVRILTTSMRPMSEASWG